MDWTEEFGILLLRGGTVHCQNFR